MRRAPHRRSALVAALVAAVLAAASPAAPVAPGTRTAADPGDWRSIVNLYRAQAGEAPISEVLSWSEGATDHARYVVKNDEVGHDEVSSNPWFTPKGDAAAANGNVAGWASLPVTAQDAVELWLGGPFHGVGILDPDLRRSGFGSYAEAGGTVVSAAVLDVLRGVSDGAHTTYPVLWPGSGAVVPVTGLSPELPEPLTSCPGYVRPAGQPLYAFFATPPTVGAVTLRDVGSGATLERCVLTGTTYVNGDPDLQSLGRSVLASRNAVVVIPRAPLVDGRSYEISVTADGQTVASTFSTGPLAWGPFYDVPPTHPFVADITWLVEQGITTGFADGTFRPTGPVSRMAMVAFLWRLAGEPAPIDPDPGFSDVGVDHPFRTPIAWAVEQGITSGYPDGTFRPTAVVTRQAAMAFLWRSQGEPGPYPDPGFPDVSPTSPFRDAIAWGVGEGITGGYPDGGFHPGTQVTRQAAAAFLHRASTT